MLDTPELGAGGQGEGEHDECGPVECCDCCDDCCSGCGEGHGEGSASGSGSGSAFGTGPVGGSAYHDQQHSTLTTPGDWVGEVEGGTVDRWGLERSLSDVESQDMSDATMSPGDWDHFFAEGVVEQTVNGASPPSGGFLSVPDDPRPAGDPSAGLVGVASGELTTTLMSCCAGGSEQQRGGLFSVPDPGIQNYDWHHLLPQDLRWEFWTQAGIDIDDAEWGWMMDPADHQKLHAKGWLQEWRDFFEKHQRQGTKPTPRQVRNQLNKMAMMDEYNGLLNKGIPADRSWKDWRKLVPEQKVAASRKLAGAALGVLVIFGAADDAAAAFSPVLALGDPALQAAYREAIKAIQDGKYDKAEDALFGSAEDDGTFFLEDNPDGMVKKMFSRLCQANQLTQRAAIGLLPGLRAKFQKWCRQREGLPYQ